ncbi:hypothetical protein EDD17DRAFT_283191 [Pisolithus thermaeus]|nr:hypothetical protein EDD17DRAFT_283191 [Pisolithus thermaeus]
MRGLDRIYDRGRSSQFYRASLTFMIKKTDYSQASLNGSVATLELLNRHVQNARRVVVIVEKCSSKVEYGTTGSDTRMTPPGHPSTASSTDSIPSTASVSNAATSALHTVLLCPGTVRRFVSWQAREHTNVNQQNGRVWSLSEGSGNDSTPV